MRYVVLLRGINVGGRNKVAMPALRELLGDHFQDVSTYIQTGNVVLESDRSATEVATEVERILPTGFDLDSALVRALALDPTAYRSVLDDAPAGFGSEPDTYRYDVGLYLGVTAADVEPYIAVNPDVDEVTCGDRAFYHRRVTALASRSRVSKIIGTPVYPSLTIRNWRTVTTLGQMLEATA